MKKDNDMLSQENNFLTNLHRKSNTLPFWKDWERDLQNKIFSPLVQKSSLVNLNSIEPREYVIDVYPFYGQIVVQNEEDASKLAEQGLKGFRLVIVRKMNPKFDTNIPERWAIFRDDGFALCLGKNGEWNYQTSNSERNEDFYNLNRFESLEEAVLFYFTWKVRAVEEFEKSKKKE